MNRTRMRLVAGGVLTAAVLAVGVSIVAVNCSGPESQSPIQFGDPPMWTHEDVGLDSVIGASIRRNSIVLVGERDRQEQLVVAETESGAVRWSVAAEQLLPGGDDLRVGSGHANPFTGTDDSPVITGKGENWSIAVSYSRSDEDSDAGGAPVEWGIATLSGADGSLEWARPLAEPDEGGDKEKPGFQDGVFPVAADGGTVLAATGVGPQAFAVDAETGEKRWDRKGIWPYSMGGGVVVGQESGPDATAPWDEGHESAGAVYGWDAKTGKERWKTGGTGDRFILNLATETVAVASDTEASRNLLIDVESGTELAEIDGWTLECATDDADPDLLACSDDTLYVVTASDGEATVSEHTLPGDREEFTVTSVYGDWIFVRADEDSTTYQGGYLLDTEAELLAKDVPGRPAAMSKEYALFLPGESEYDEDYGKAALYQVVKS